MTIKLLAWTAIVAALTITEALAADEPDYIVKYKASASLKIDSWAAEMDKRYAELQAAADDWVKAREASKAIAEKRRLEQEKGRLERDKKDLETKLEMKELQKKMDDQQRDIAKKAGRPTPPPANAAEIEQIKSDIKKLAEAISAKASEIRAVEANATRAGGDELSIKQQNVQQAALHMSLSGPAIQSVEDVGSPAANPNALEKDAHGNYKVEWGPRLEVWLREQITAKTTKWAHVHVDVKVSWSQSIFADRKPPAVSVTVPPLGVIHPAELSSKH